jgi:hypothetical protein
MKKITNIVAVIVFLGVFSSCLKDDKYALDPSGSHNVVEFYNVTAPVNSYNDLYVMYVPATLEVLPEVEFTAGVNYAGPENTAPQDIVVELAVAANAVTEYNDVESTGYEPLPAGSYEIPSSVTIRKGEKFATFPIKVRPEMLDPTQSNALGVSITSTSHGVISGNVGTVIYSLPIKSIWEGAYEVTVINDYGGIDGNIGGTKTDSKMLSTVGPNKVRSDGESGLWFTYGGYTEYQFNGDNTDITGIVVYSGSVLASNIDEVVLVDAENRIFEINYTGLGRGIRERWVRTGD